MTYVYDFKTIENNFKYHSPNEEQTATYNLLREQAKSFAMAILRECPDSPERTLAFRRLEESVMWANASIAREKK